MTGLGAAEPRPQALVRWMTLESERSSSRSSMRPLPSVMPSRISSIRLVPSRQGMHLPHDSCCVNPRKYLAKATMQLPVSVTMSPPDPIMLPSFLSDS